MYDPGQKKGWHYTDKHNTAHAAHVVSEWNNGSIWKRFKMRMQLRHVVVATHSGLKIVTLHGSKKHSHEICVCPPHFRPGDERFVQKGARGTILFDAVGRKAHHEHKHAHHVKTEDWNARTPLQRFVHKLKRR